MAHLPNGTPSKWYTFQMKWYTFQTPLRYCEAKQQERAKQRAVADYRRQQMAHSKCAYCLDSPARPKHLHVAYGNLAYLMLPPSGGART